MTSPGSRFSGPGKGGNNVFAFWETVKVVGLPKLLRFFQAYRLGWRDMISGFYSTRVVQALFNVGFFDALLREGRVDAKAFSEAKGVDCEILLSLCDYLYALDLFTKDGTEYSLTARGSSVAGPARGWFEAVYGYEPILHALEDLLQKEKRYGCEVRRREEHVIRGNERVEDLIHFPLALETISRRGFKRVLDMGCGEGTFLRRLCAADPEAVGFGIDLNSEAIARGRKAASEAGLGERIRLCVQDFTRLGEAENLPQGLDAATFFLVLHERLYQGPEAVVSLLRNVRKALPGVPLIIFEVIRPGLEQMRRRPGMSVQYLLHHELSRQKLAPMEAWEELLNEAGLRITEARRLDFLKTAVFIAE
jgi:SAM-dependent methyltransferase